MDPTADRSFNSLVEEILGTPLPQGLSDLVPLPDLPPAARGIAARMLALMKRAGYPATDIMPQMLRLLAVVTPAMLPAAWGGLIPPVTAPGRHQKLDAYVAHAAPPAGPGPPVFVDLGCGFPPVTTAETARRLPGWSVVGVDRALAPYVLYDPDGRYACFDREGRFQYCQSPNRPLHENPAAVRSRFEERFAALAPRLEIHDPQARAAVEADGFRLIVNHVRDFEAENLRFVTADIGDLQAAPARVIRCMNVLLYFPKPARQELRAAMGALLEDGGTLISGFNHPFGIYARYAVYGKGEAGVTPREFAFSPDNLRPLGIGPWVTIEDEDEEADLLADLTGAIRADRTFWPEFNARVDALQAELGLCRRGADGFNRLTPEAEAAPPQVLMEKSAAVWRALVEAGATDGAAAALRRAGYRAWKNAVGDIAVQPPAGALPAI